LSSTTQFVSIVIILLALATHLILTQTIRRRQRAVPLRSIQAYEMLPLMIGESIEADRPIHLSFGSTGLGGTNTVLTVAAAELAYQVAQRTATGAVAPIITMSDPTTIPLAQDTLRRAYVTRDRLDRYRSGSVRWFPSGAQSLAFAAALTSTLGDDQVSGNVLMGTYGPELALILEAAARRSQPAIATSDRIEGQAVAYAMSDYPLIGEEVFTAGAYLGDNASHTAAVVTMDVLRTLLILIIVIYTANALSNGALFQSLTRLIGSR
jgi:hypothetical protein